MHRAPDCDMKAIEPIEGVPAANEAFIGTKGSITPRQLGPMIRMPYRRAMSSSSLSLLAPSSPASRNPALITTAPLAPFLPDSSRTVATNLLGTTMTTRSMGPGTSSTDG